MSVSLCQRCYRTQCISRYRYIRSLLVIRSANNAIAISLPALASVLAFVVYSATGHSLNAADIFSSLTLFNLLRMPLMFLRTFQFDTVRGDHL